MEDLSWAKMHTPSGEFSHNICRLSEKAAPKVILDQGQKWITFRHSKTPSFMAPILKMVTVFVNKYNCSEDSNTVLTSVEELHLLTSDDRGELGILKNEAGEIIGTIAATYLDFQLGQGSECPQKSGYISLLCVHPDYRNKGVAMKLIRLLMQSGHEREMRNGYYLTFRPQHRCSLILQGWYRPVIFERALEDGFGIPGYTEKHSESANRHDRKSKEALRIKLRYKSNMPSGYDVEKTEKNTDMFDICIHFLSSLLDTQYKDETVSLDMSRKTLSSFCDLYDVLTISKNYSVAAVVIVRCYNVRIKSTLRVSSVGHVCMLEMMQGEELSTILNSVVAYYSSKKGKTVTVLYGYYLGRMTEFAMKSWNHVRTSKQPTVEMYNSDIALDHENFRLPVM